MFLRFPPEGFRADDLKKCFCLQAVSGGQVPAAAVLRPHAGPTSDTESMWLFKRRS